MHKLKSSDGLIVDQMFDDIEEYQPTPKPEAPKY